MLTISFCCFDGIGPQAEQKIWQHDLLSWQAVTQASSVACLSAKKLKYLQDQISQARHPLGGGVYDYFLNRFSPPQRPRLYPHIRKNLLYIDIETTGLRPDDTIVSVATYNGADIRWYVQGINMEQLITPLAHAPCLVTFNGSAFDLPRLRKHFNLNLSQPHLDLLPISRAHGLTGSLHQVATLLSIQTPEDCKSTDIPHLWAQWTHGSCSQSLRELLIHNACDVLLLEQILRRLYERDLRCFPAPIRIGIARQPCPEILAKAFFDNL